MEVTKGKLFKYSLYTSASSGSKKNLSTEDTETGQEDCSWPLDPSRFSLSKVVENLCMGVSFYRTIVDYQAWKDQQEN